jgi:hypothetical protein
MTKLSDYKIKNTIRGKMSRKEYWARRKELRAQYRKQLNQLEHQAHASNPQTH